MHLPWYRNDYKDSLNKFLPEPEQAGNLPFDLNTLITSGEKYHINADNKEKATLENLKDVPLEGGSMANSLSHLGLVNTFVQNDINGHAKSFNDTANEIKKNVAPKVKAK